jgi:hypothetical protein
MSTETPLTALHQYIDAFNQGDTGTMDFDF